MKTVAEYHNELTDLVDRNHAEWEQETIARVILAEESQRQSKRELLGLNRRHRTTNLPLFTEKKLF